MDFWLFYYHHGGFLEAKVIKWEREPGACYLPSMAVNYLKIHVTVSSGKLSIALVQKVPWISLNNLSSKGIGIQRIIVAILYVLGYLSHLLYHLDTRTP